MDMMIEQPPEVTGRLMDAAMQGHAAVGSALNGSPVPASDSADQAMTVANFLAYVMFTMQLANGLHPRSAVDFILDETRGGVLARQFLTEGTIEICCDYCGELLAASMAAAVSHQMRAVHVSRAPQQWDALMIALTGIGAEPPF